MGILPKNSMEKMMINHQFLSINRNQQESERSTREKSIYRFYNLKPDSSSRAGFFHTYSDKCTFFFWDSHRCRGHMKAHVHKHLVTWLRIDTRPKSVHGAKEGKCVMPYSPVVNHGHQKSIIDYFPSYKTAFGSGISHGHCHVRNRRVICQAASKEAAQPLLQDTTGAKLSCCEHPELEAFF